MISGARKLITGERGDKQPLEMLERLMILYDVDPRDEEVLLLKHEVDQWFESGNMVSLLIMIQFEC
jgi:hypothetical protein